MKRACFAPTRLQRAWTRQPTFRSRWSRSRSAEACRPGGERLSRSSHGSGNGEVFQHGKGLRLHFAGGRRQGRLRSRHGGGSSRDAYAERGPEDCLRYSARRARRKGGEFARGLSQGTTFKAGGAREPSPPVFFGGYNAHSSQHADFGKLLQSPARCPPAWISACPEGIQAGQRKNP